MTHVVTWEGTEVLRRSPVPEGTWTCGVGKRGRHGGGRRGRHGVGGSGAGESEGGGWETACGCSGQGYAWRARVRGRVGSVRWGGVQGFSAHDFQHRQQTHTHTHTHSQADKTKNIQ